MLRVAVFASGTGTNLSAIVDAARSAPGFFAVALVIVSRADAGAGARAAAAGIPCAHISSATHATAAERDDAMLELLAAHRVDLIALAGYLKRISPYFIARFGKPILNIHPALLPEFGGQGMYGCRVFEAVLASGAKASGVTIHLVDEQYDHGPIVFQEAIAVLDGDTVESLAARTQALEHRAYPLVLRRIAEGEIDVGGGGSDRRSG
ncbi:MAG: phosphoribosylglycinamide formyltransferase [Candidatus Schekmanbacteria bacterium]|nr:phosphoribosylglycinamide formyltransferase [Candidatus Schekmanbacteria bacterium]